MRTNLLAHNGYRMQAGYMAEDTTVIPDKQQPAYGFGANVNVQWAQRYPCGCWTLNLGQGVAALPCAAHQPAVLNAIKSSV